MVTRVTGEVPNDTDSGYMFARMARQQLGLDERQIMSNREALETLLREGPRPVVFVNDFVGSGDQFISTWEREYELTGGTTASFQRLSEVRGGFFCYCPVFVAETGRDAIRRECQSVLLSPAHFLQQATAPCPITRSFGPTTLGTRHSTFLKRPVPGLEYTSAYGWVTETKGSPGLRARRSRCYHADLLPRRERLEAFDQMDITMMKSDTLQEQLSQLFGSYKAEWLKEQIHDLFTRPSYFPELTTTHVHAF